MEKSIWLSSQFPEMKACINFKWLISVVASVFTQDQFPLELDLSCVSPWTTGAWECSRDAALPKKYFCEHLKWTKLLRGCEMSKQHRTVLKSHGCSKVTHGLCFTISSEASPFCSRCLLCFHRVDNLSKYFSGLKEQEKRFKVLEAQVSSIF